MHKIVNGKKITMTEEEKNTFLTQQERDSLQAQRHHLHGQLFLLEKMLDSRRFQDELDILTGSKSKAEVEQERLLLLEQRNELIRSLMENPQ